MVELHHEGGLLSLEECKQIFSNNNWESILRSVAVNKESDVIKQMAGIMDKHGFSYESKGLHSMLIHIHVSFHVYTK